MPQKVLVTEDDVAMREILTHKLMSQGFEVKEVEDGKQALEIISTFKPDIMMLDLQMPELDGFGVLEAVRKNPDPAIAKVPIIVLSNLWSNEDILKAKSFNVSDYLVKAYFTPDEILGKIRDVLAKQNGKTINY